MTNKQAVDDTAIIKSSRVVKPTAQLVIRSGPAEGSSVPLQVGQIITIGRAQTNRLVIPDEICSRNHCEVFYDSGVWKLRDLGSRNGTRVNGEPISGDIQLTDGRQFQIGSTFIAFTCNTRTGAGDEVGVNTTANQINETVNHGQRHTVLEPRPSGQLPEIIHRTETTRYRSPDVANVHEVRGHEAQRLVRLGLRMAEETDVRVLASIVLDEIFAVTSADLGAVLLWNEADSSYRDHRNLDVVAYKSREASRPFERISDYVTNMALESRTAIVAHDIKSDGQFTASDSLRAMQAESIICAPIRTSDRLLGLIQLYSTNPDNRLQADDAEFALAVADQLAVLIENLNERRRLAAGLARVETENKTLREQLLIETELVGDSESIRRLRDRILRIAPTGATVLIRGESGVGKELVARAIHQHSSRADGPFVTMNCAALSESLLESELFGHEKGSFTGAVSRKIGKFEQAHGGTIFLDEVGEMSPAIQAKFLRVLEGHPYERVGGGGEVRVDVRVVAATNRDLEDSVEQGRFRKDLYFRLQVMELVVEPLRERRTDIAILAKHFMQRFSKKCGRNVTSILPTAMSTLVNYGWPGNVRELQNTIERAVILCSGDTLAPVDIQLSALGRSDAPATSSLSNSGYRAVPIDVIEQEHILATLEWTKWNKSQAAHILEIERSTLDRKLKKYEVERPSRK
ncbi:sigma 54-interacting transcriptional regulator [Schlesneria sp.]|uniref:sigma 54-interacting transcriptional regulator n=1 Tax=Schlesneria sp. TaxID=2762018 RepID=UPI002F0A2A44